MAMNINKDEMGLLFELFNFYKAFDQLDKEWYDKSLFFLGVLFFKLRPKLNHLFTEQDHLKEVNWKTDQNLQILQRFYNIMFKSEIEYFVLRGNINIMNSPLTKFSIKRKNNSILSIKNTLDVSTNDFNKSPMTSNHTLIEGKENRNAIYIREKINNIEN